MSPPNVELGGRGCDRDMAGVLPFGSDIGNNGGDDDPDAIEPLDEGGLSIELLFSLRSLEIPGLVAENGNIPFCPLAPGLIMVWASLYFRYANSLSFRSCFLLWENS